MQVYELFANKQFIHLHSRATQSILENMLLACYASGLFCLISTHNSSSGPAARLGGKKRGEDTSRSGRGLRPLHPHL